MKRLTSLITSLLLCAMLVVTISQTVCDVEDIGPDEYFEEISYAKTISSEDFTVLVSEIPNNTNDNT